jgi:isoleucyl-tRNA synthetase
MLDSVKADYAKFEFHPAVARIQAFCAEDLGAFYLDILKDRLYTSAANSLARRSAQTALWHITRSLLTAMAPVLSFTAEEAWSFVSKDLTIFTHVFEDAPAVEGAAALQEKWQLIRASRAQVMRAIEALRADGKVGASLQATVAIAAAGPSFDALASLKDELKFVMITSQASVIRASDDSEARVTVLPSTAAKCERCWHYSADVGSHADHPSLCTRCFSNVYGTPAGRHYA